MIKLIITDMDGTLLNDEHKIHPEFWEVEKKLRDKGIMFSVASGRQYYNLASKFEQLKGHMMFFAENGSYVVHKDKELYTDTMDREQANEFIKLGREAENCNLVLCGVNSAYAESEDDEFINEVSKYYKRLEIVEDLTKVDDKVLKVTLCNFEGVEENTYPKFEKFKDNYKVAIASRIFIDIMSNTANKGNAIKGVQKELNISPEETMVFGDYLNDLEMMQNAKYSYAMKNAHPEIIKVSNYITKYDNNENGVVETIREMGLLD
ncbi:MULTISPECIES: HAD family hydrolase [unclassified Zunongwangia]|uniref:HAD family hydrolase n=1 Tax=unclassified Zunongwangia TaxID=2632541 RepID=UPI0022DDC91B|nr:MULTISPECIES: HAD family hydrolase [unclassified Zunongwangia]WBL21329.1 HAD family hydrolase [Zunongwangia sp. HRR-M8]WBL26819.1 HAD family hydrolase [Zunongwangia sp. HGR-M22]